VSSTDGVWYGKSFDAVPDLSFTADSAGRVRVGRNPFSNEPLNWLHGSTVMLWRVQHAGRVRYVFIDASEFNKEYWRGNTALGRYTVPVEFKVTSAGRALPLRIEAESFNRAFDTTTGNTGGACGTGDVDMETTTDPNGGTCNVGWTQPGEWLEYDVSVATAQTFDFVARVASGMPGANFHIELDGVKVGSTLTAPNAGWQGFADRTISGVNVSPGNHVIRVVFETANVNLNYLDVRAVSTGTAVPARLQAEDYVRFWDSTAGNQGGACRAGDVDFQNTTDTGAGCNLGWSTAGEWIEFDVRVATPRTFNLIARVASGVASRTFRMEVDGVQVGATQTAPSSGWQAFANRTVTTGTLSAGVHRVRVVFINGDVNLNYVDMQ
jgi:hypothetical protein